MFLKNLNQTKKLFLIFESFTLFLIIITIFQMQQIYDNSILVKEDDINRTKHLQILLLILFIANYIANVKSKYEMSGFNGNKFYANCLLLPGMLIESYVLYELFNMTLSEMTIALLTLSIIVFMTVDFLIDFNIYQKFNKNHKKRIIIKEGQEGINLV